jgi:hypothetical protein
MAPRVRTMQMKMVLAIWKMELRWFWRRRLSAAIYWGLDWALRYSTA